MEIARFNKRVFSYLVDFLISIGIGAGCSVPLFMFAVLPWYFSMMISFLICYVVYLLINVPVMYFSKGRSFGAFIFGIKTVTKENGTISSRNIWVKQLYLGLIPFVVANAIYMLVVHTEQTLFDRITNTIVIDIKNSETLNDTLPESEKDNPEA
ncbi:MAG: RDD family protein [Bacilli bacterium]|nr:RDD family protein [Bacilli bacterium]